MKAQDPVGTGILNGTWNFGKDAVVGAYDLLTDPGQAIVGFGKLLYAIGTTDPVTHIPLTPQAWELFNAEAQVFDKFENGDAYTKSSMITYGGLTLASLFTGVGEEKAAVSASKIGTEVGEMSVYVPKAPLQIQEVAGVKIPLPDPLAEGYAHTTLGGKISEETGVLYRQSATFGESSWPLANGKTVPYNRVDWYHHGSPWHHMVPHQHPFYWNGIQWVQEGGAGLPFLRK